MSSLPQKQAVFKVRVFYATKDQTASCGVPNPQMVNPYPC